MLRHILLLATASAVLLSTSYADLRIATYNLKNYLTMDRMVDGTWRPEYPKPEEEKSALRKVILGVNPDVLALQEIGGLDYLEELRSDLAAEGLEYRYVLHLRGADQERQVAVLSNREPIEVVKHTNLGFKYLDRREFVKRGLLEVSFKDHAGGLFKLFVVHLKSKFTDEKTDPQSQLRRTREAQACRDRIVERTFNLHHDRFLVTGDFNDHPGSAPLRRFYRRGAMKLGSLVPATDPSGLVWTHFYKKHGQYSLVDGFVASPKMLPLIKDGRAHVAGGLESLIGSDHRLVYLDLRGISSRK